MSTSAAAITPLSPIINGHEALPLSQPCPRRPSLAFSVFFRAFCARTTTQRRKGFETTARSERASEQAQRSNPSSQKEKKPSYIRNITHIQASSPKRPPTPSSSKTVQALPENLACYLQAIPIARVYAREILPISPSNGVVAPEISRLVVSPTSTQTTRALRDNMLDAFFASRRRNECAAAAAIPPPQALVSAPMTSSYASNESLMGMYSKQSPSVDQTPFPNRSSYPPGEARKSLMAYMHPEFSHADAAAAAATGGRPTTVVLRSGDNNNEHHQPHQDHGVIGGERANKNKPTNRGFLASVWALGSYMTVATVDSTREVINDVVTLAAGFAREKRSYAASVSSSGSEYVGTDSEEESIVAEDTDVEEGVEDYDDRRPEGERARDKGKARESDDGTELGMAGSGATPVVTNEPVSPKIVPEIENMPLEDSRPVMDRHLSKSAAELREMSEVAKNQDSEFEGNHDAEKNPTQEKIREMIRFETEQRAIDAAITIQRAWRESQERANSRSNLEQFPEIVNDLAETGDETPVPQAPEKSPLRKNSVPIPAVEPENEAGKQEEKKEEQKAENDKEEKKEELASDKKPSIDLAAGEVVIPAVEPEKVAAPAAPVQSIEAEETDTVPTSIEKPASRDVAVEDAPAVDDKNSNSVERRVVGAFRRNSIRRSMSKFGKKDKKNPESPAVTAPAVAVEELTPPPTPPMTEDQSSLQERERPKSRMSMFGLTKKLTEKDKKEKEKEKSEKKEKDSKEPATPRASESANAETPSSIPRPDLTKRRSLLSIASSYKDKDRPTTPGESLPAVTEGSPSGIPRRRPTFRGFGSSSNGEGNDRKSRTKSWLGGRRPKLNDKGEFVIDTSAEPAAESTSAVATPIEPATPTTPATPVTPAVASDEAGPSERPKFLNAMKKAPTFGLGGAHGRSVSSSAVSTGSAASLTEKTTAAATGTTTEDSPAKLKGAARMKALTRAATFMGRSKKDKEKDKGKGKEVAVE
ncbi:hypothetical protein BZA77DRAFT_367760 [Pyronema omphalodes]|nr:hypothetical protein BZA77DRAFT_367760 [Pyronema omphalodes]